MYADLQRKSEVTSTHLSLTDIDVMASGSSWISGFWSLETTRPDGPYFPRISSWGCAGGGMKHWGFGWV